MSVICDLDGTIANCEHRLHWILNKPKNWKKFGENMHLDSPILPTIRIIQNLAYMNEVILFSTGRSEEYRKVSKDWIVKNVFPYDFFNYEGRFPSWKLYMRPEKNYDKDFNIKAENLQKMYDDGYKPECAFDDRQGCVDMYREKGLITYQVAKGDY